jgi:hypothetical protein
LGGALAAVGASSRRSKLFILRIGARGDGQSSCRYGVDI